jgi:hypothetical protein
LVQSTASCARDSPPCPGRYRIDVNNGLLWPLRAPRCVPPPPPPPPPRISNSNNSVNSRVQSSSLLLLQAPAKSRNNEQHILRDGTNGEHGCEHGRARRVHPVRGCGPLRQDHAVHAPGGDAKSRWYRRGAVALPGPHHGDGADGGANLWSKTPMDDSRYGPCKHRYGHITNMKPGPWST